MAGNDFVVEVNDKIFFAAFRLKFLPELLGRQHLAAQSILDEDVVGLGLGLA
jgi:hypothetical protein